MTGSREYKDGSPPGSTDASYIEQYAGRVAEAKREARRGREAARRDELADRAQWAALTARGALAAADVMISGEAVARLAGSLLLTFADAD